jgi:hypothetical protein
VSAIYWSWGISAGVLILLAARLGNVAAVGKGPLGILIDGRGRFSLTHLQLVTWSIAVLSLVSGVFFGRLIDGVSEPLSFSIPSEVLGLLGITAGSSVAATAVKSAKDATAPARIAASNLADKPRLAQIFLLEEGAYADKVIDVTKFQGFVLTIILIAAYVALAIQAIHDAGTAKEVTSLPGFSGTFLTLLGISQGTYVLGKVPNQEGTPDGLSVAHRTANLTAVPPGGPRNS